MEFFAGFAEAGRPWRLAFLVDSPQQPARHFTRVCKRISPAISSLQFPPLLSRRSDPRLSSTGFPPCGDRPTFQDNPPPPPSLGEFFKKAPVSSVGWCKDWIWMKPMKPDKSSGMAVTDSQLRFTSRNPSPSLPLFQVTPAKRLRSNRRDNQPLRASLHLLPPAMRGLRLSLSLGPFGVATHLN